MPYFLEFSPGYGFAPGLPARRARITRMHQMPYWKARQYYQAARIGTPVMVKL
jgi:hypothetical protein